MRRGTTPTLIFEVPFDPETVEALYITLAQERMSLEKTLADVEIETTGTEHKVMLPLAQSETLKFAQNQKIEIQMAVRFSDGTVDRSNIISTTMKRILKEAEI